MGGRDHLRLEQPKMRGGCRRIVGRLLQLKLQNLQGIKLNSFVLLYGRDVSYGRVIVRRI